MNYCCSLLLPNLIVVLSEFLLSLIVDFNKIVLTKIDYLVFEMCVLQQCKNLVHFRW